MQTCPPRSIAKACVTDTMRGCAAITAGSQTCSIGWNAKRSSSSTRAYSRRVPIAQLVTTGPVTTPAAIRSTTGSVITSEWIARSRRSIRCASIWFATRPTPTWSVDPSSISRET